MGSDRREDRRRQSQTVPDGQSNGLDHSQTESNTGRSRSQGQADGHREPRARRAGDRQTGQAWVTEARDERPPRAESFVGRGPKAYKRSDERLTEDANEALTRSSALDASEIEVECSSGEITLTGTVSSRRAKRLAQDLVEDISGVKNVMNYLRVQTEESSIPSDSNT